MEVEHSAGTRGHQPGVKTTGWITNYKSFFDIVRPPWIILPRLNLFVNIGWTYTSISLMAVFSARLLFDIPLSDTRVVVYEFINTLWYGTYIVRTCANHI